MTQSSVPIESLLRDPPAGLDLSEVFFRARTSYMATMRRGVGLTTVMAGTQMEAFSEPQPRPITEKVAPLEPVVQLKGWYGLPADTGELTEFFMKRRPQTERHETPTDIGNIVEYWAARRAFDDALEHHGHPEIKVV